MTSDGPQGELDLKHQEVYTGEEFYMPKKL